MQFKPIATICSGQDGAIWGSFLFRFRSDGSCYVYETAELMRGRNEAAKVFANFRLDQADRLQPHSNAVVWGCEYAVPGDEFPLLYTNIYNTYARAADRMEGVCCVYRLRREETTFCTELVQVIRLDFTKDESLWCSPGGQDIRPYGNFVIDRESNTYYAFTMRDADQTTRYFSFRLPKWSDGEMDERFGVRTVTLCAADIVDWFDCPYHHYVQGACVHNGKIYSLEGFTDDEQNPPMLRIIDPKQKRELVAVSLGTFGLSVEPELIDFGGECCLYADHAGNLYEITF